MGTCEEKTDWSEESDANHSSEKFDIPKEIWMMVDHLFRHGLNTEELFSRGGIHTELLQIRDSLDTGTPESLPGSIYSIGEALMLFLESLRDPVIPFAYYHKCLEASNNFTLCKQVLKKIPRSHRNVFKYLAAFIRELLLHNDDNKMDPKTLNQFCSLVLYIDCKGSRVTRGSKRSVKHYNSQDEISRDPRPQIYNFSQSGTYESVYLLSHSFRRAIFTSATSREGEGDSNGDIDTEDSRSTEVAKESIVYVSVHLKRIRRLTRSSDSEENN
ncbi:putative inositol polyphosphate 5-phosphatase OCRL-1 [Apostichopus japonicus]|uniref:Putative inositol polyphosphate 5-phosphatase OCRL-1 n=1 Tax=Stichopus japonicus TaxID=307972 RepID=A0A2G8JXQ3_STIJA|nr:putative inositol polyphosphate 5-phosphatase OCRL-1 [Apostichopus japonicus]